MCMLLYLASDAPLRLMPWNPASPAFHVDVAERDRVPAVEVIAGRYI